MRLGTRFQCQIPHRGASGTPTQTPSRRGPTRQAPLGAKAWLLGGCRPSPVDGQECLRWRCQEALCTWPLPSATIAPRRCPAHAPSVACSSERPRGLRDGRRRAGSARVDLPCRARGSECGSWMPCAESNAQKPRGLLLMKTTRPGWWRAGRWELGRRGRRVPAQAAQIDGRCRGCRCCPVGGRGGGIR